MNVKERYCIALKGLQLHITHSAVATAVLGCPLRDTASPWSNPNMVAVIYRSWWGQLCHSGVWGEKAFSALQSSAQP